MLQTVLCHLFTPIQTVLIVLTLVSSRQGSEKSIKMVWQPFLFQRNYGYCYVTRNHHPQNNLRVSYPGYVVSMIYDSMRKQDANHTDYAMRESWHVCQLLNHNMMIS